MRLRVAAAAWKLRPAKGDSDYFGHFHDLVSEAHDEGAEVVVFPELHQLELLPIFPDLEEHDAAKFLAQYDEAIEGWIKRISDSSGLIIVGGSHFKNSEEGIKNVCAIGIPGQDIVIAEKNNLTSYERDFWGIQRGQGLARLPKKLGVTICYDSEFPEAARVLAESGVMVHCVPAWTETQQGFQRVRWSCLARAIENQYYVIHSSLVGSIGYEPAPFSFGTSAIIAPSVEPFPDAAILRETLFNEEGLVVADLDFRLLHQSRTAGAVSNWADRLAGNWELGEEREWNADETEERHAGELN